MGLPVFFLTKDFIGLTLAVMLMAIVAAPAFICAIYQKNGLFFEQTVKNMIYFFKNPRIRTYQSENIYIQIQNEIEYMKLKKKLQRGAKATNGRIKKISAQKNKAVKRRN